LTKLSMKTKSLKVCENVLQNTIKGLDQAKLEQIGRPCR
jgi:hypothetical protein